jgi:hypothetical protein
MMEVVTFYAVVLLALAGGGALGRVVAWWIERRK